MTDFEGVETESARAERGDIVGEEFVDDEAGTTKDP